jgi:DNA helicase-2/ATP-dependent DNA helicase PcrA
MPSRPSSFLADLPKALLDEQKTMKARSSGRGFLSPYGQRGAYGRSAFGRGADADDAGAFPTSPSARRPGTPVSRAAPSSPSGAAFADDADVSQDAPTFVVGARVRHRKFGSGTIAELSGTGRDAKARIDFDDEAVGRKTLVIAQANLERGWD